MDTEGHRLTVKVYLEDTDAEGRVYHANYLKYFERSRSEILEHQGLKLADWAKEDRLYVVHEMHIKFKRPALLGDSLEVGTTYRRASDFRVTFQHALFHPGDGTPLVTAEAQVVCVDRRGNLQELPAGILSDPSP
jgi:tol-pal system-associated acyl-CoA thioesterase